MRGELSKVRSYMIQELERSAEIILGAPHIIMGDRNNP
jgi:hypothetical protein